MIGSYLLAALGFGAEKKPPTPSSTPTGELTASVLVAESEAGWHVLTIEGYTNVKALVDTGKCVTTRTFTVGDHRWHIKYFPNGEDEETAGYISIYLVHLPDATAAAGEDVLAWFRFTLLDHDAGEDKDENVPWEGFHKTQLYTWKADGSSEWGHRMLIHRSSKLESSRSPVYLRDDCIRIRCDVVVSKKEILRRTTDVLDDDGTAAAAAGLAVPPPDIGMDLLQLLWDGEGSDVSFEVAGETVLAHRYILAARSPVFMAELYGPMKEMTETCVRIHDMEARVFRMLLHFVYTDWLPEMGKGDVVVMSQHLLVAADRYCLERLKLICEDNLCRCVNVSNVGTSLALAEQHGCQGLKKACVQFLQSGSNLKAALVTDGFQHLTTSCPNVLEELLAMIAP